MEFTKERRIYRSTLVQRGFLGYHPSSGIGKGEWSYEENLSSRCFPHLCPRESRRRLLTPELQGIGALDTLCYVAEGTLYYGDHSIELPLTEGEKELIPFGAYLIIRPDMLWVNTVEHSYGFCEKGEMFQGDLGILWCDREGQPLEPVVDGSEAPENTMQYWLDTQHSPPILKVYSQDTGLWHPMDQTYIRIVADGIGAQFPTGSRVKVDGDHELERIIGAGLREILDSGRDHIMIAGTMDSIRKELRQRQWKITCPVPIMDYLLCHENRLWGCRYGRDHNGSFVNEIYACALGDFTAWYTYRGIASDSYTASLGTQGPFTGAAVVGGYPVFFKEDSLTRIYGSHPSNFRLQTVPCVGVAKGSDRSSALLDGALVYLGRDGFYLYDGSLPRKISSDLDAMHYSNGVGGTCGSYYYADVCENGIPVTMCYDKEHGLWHRESSMWATKMVSHGDVLYYMSLDNMLYAVGTQLGEAAEKQVSWEAVSDILREDEPRKGYLTGLTLRLSMESGSRLSVFAEYDSCGAWEPLGTLCGGPLYGREVPLRLRRCDHLRLRFQGQGNVTVHTLFMNMEG